MYVVKPPSWDKGSGRYIVYLRCSPIRFLGTKQKGEGVLPVPCPRRRLYQIHCHSVNTYGHQHRSGGAQKNGPKKDVEP